MRKVIISLLAAAMLTACTRQNDISEAIDRQVAHYPQTAMQDIYKSFYQDRFGSEHMINDTAAVREYLSYELAVAVTDSVPNPYYEMVGAQGRCVRVYLRCVNEELLTEGQLLDAFIRSAKSANLPELSWADEWAHIEQAAREAGVPCTEEESQLLRQAAQGNRAVHHSDAYRNAYHPHYRIVKRTIFENELKTLIEQ